MARTVSETDVRRLLDAEATRLLAGERDLGPRVAAAAAAERRRSRERRLTFGSFAAAALLVAWLGAAPPGQIGAGGDLAAPRPTQGVPGTGWPVATPAPVATAPAPVVLSPLATATATTTSTPLPTS
ncbi:MAG TPA: hypothetical protein VG370_18585 [Chloroflexota bacterium]|jgi:hypothetical protein|nr:hypothetical protein [Chloroflexota bacterium]